MSTMHLSKRHALFSSLVVVAIAAVTVGYASSSGLLMETRFEFFAPADVSARITSKAATTSAPVITNVSLGTIADTTATVTWITNIPADSRLRVWIDKPYGLSFTDSAKVTSHSLTATGLKPGTRYGFVVRSSANGKLTTSPIGTFTTTSSTVPPPTPTAMATPTPTATLVASPSPSPTSTPISTSSPAPSITPAPTTSPVGTWDTAPYTTYPIPAAPALPSKGGVMTDPTFGTAVMRITDGTDGASSNIAYSYWPTFNRTSTKLYVNNVGGSPAYYDFDPVGFSLGAKHPMFVGGGCQTEDAIWSGVNADVMYCHDLAGTIKAYDVVTQQWTTVKATGKNGIQMSKTPDDQVFAWTWQDANYQPIGYVVYNRTTDTVKTASTTSIDEVQIDKTGRYLVYKTGLQGAGVVEVRVVDLVTNAVTDLIDDRDYAPGHSDNGSGMVYGIDNWLNRVLSRTLANPKTWTQLLQFPDWTQSNHISALSDDGSSILVSNFTVGGSTSATPLKDEIFLVSTDGSGAVKHIAHHHSAYASYYDSPRANISRDGRFVTFASNWGRTGVTDVFVARVQ